jgi:hypothetical protein
MMFEVFQTASIYIKAVWNVKLCIQVKKVQTFSKNLLPPSSGCKCNLSTLHDITAHKHCGFNYHITKTDNTRPETVL